jgi:hypothetical protein
VSKTSSPLRKVSHSILSLAESILIRRIRITHQKAMLTLRYLTGRTLSPFPTEAEQVAVEKLTLYKFAEIASR